MKCLACKEIVSIIQFCIALFSILVVVVLTIVFRFPADLMMFAYQTSLMATALICIIFGLSTWFYNSNFSRTRLHVRIFSVVVLWILCILIVGTCYLCYSKYLGERVLIYFEPDIFDYLDYLFLQSGIYVGFAIGIITLLMNISLTILAIRKHRRIKKRRRERSGK